MKNKYPSITVGIPAHNEQSTIKDLILSVLKQKGNFKLDTIIVLCDGCTDKTEDVVTSIKDKRVKLINDHYRRGKAARLNEIYSISKSEYLVTLDADILLATHHEFSHMLAIMNKHSNARVVAGNIQTSLHPDRTTLLSMILRANNTLWAQTTQTYRSGNNIHTSQGPAYMMRRSFYSTFKLPSGITCDQGFIYISTKPNGYYFAHKTQILCNPIQKITEIKVEHSRVMTERTDLTKHFGESVLNEYNIPLAHRISAIAVTFWKQPFLTIASILFNIWIRFNGIEDTKRKNGLWTISKSSKDKIYLVN